MQILCVGRTVLSLLIFSGVLTAIAGAEEKPAATLPDLSAELQTTSIDRNGHITVTNTQVIRSGKVVRYENRSTDPTEISIEDFNAMKEYRIYESDQIYFDTVITNRLWFKAQREGLVPIENPPDLVENRILLGKDTLEGYPCEIILLIRSVKDKKEMGSDYTLLWEAPSLNRQPLRVAYYQANGILTILDYRKIKTDPIDRTLLEPPSTFLSMTPY